MNSEVYKNITKDAIHCIFSLNESKANSLNFLFFKLYYLNKVSLNIIKCSLKK